MVFGWGKKKTPDPIESSQLVKQISLNQLEIHLQEKKKELVNEIVEKAKSIREEIELKRKEIIKLFLQFESDDLGSQDIDKHLKIIIERGKSSIISGVKKETSKEINKIQDFQDVINLNLELAQLLKRIGDVLGPNSRVMHVFARKYADKLKDILADISRSKTNLQKFVDEYDILGSRISKVLEDKTFFIMSKKGNETRNATVIKTKNEIQNLSTKIQNLEKDIENLKSSKEYLEFLQVNLNLKALEVEEEKIKNQIDIQFSKISRPLGKYRYVSSLERPLRLIMERLFDKPFEVISGDTKDAIVEILQSVIKSVVAGSISVKDTDKSVEQLEETIIMLDKFIKSKKELSNTKDALTKTIVFDKKTLEEKEKNLTTLKEHQKQLELEITNLENKINETTKLLPQMIKNIESSVGEIIGDRFIISGD